MDRETIQADSAHGGAGWIPRVGSLKQELGTLWASCGVDSECGTLRKVLLHRPGSEISAVRNPASAHWDDLIDLVKAQEQFDRLREVYRRHGVEVIELEADGGEKPNQMFMRDLFAMTPQGAILARPASAVRAGEEIAVAGCLARQRIPILLTVAGTAVFEGPDMVFLDPTTVLLGIGLRTNADGARQVRHVLESQGIRVVEIQTTYGCGHLDGVLSIVDRRTAVLYPRRVSYLAYETLRELGYATVELPDREEGERRMAINMVAMEPGRVLIPAGCPRTTASLAKYGVEAIPVDVSEIMKGGGAMHCMTGVLWRASL